MFAHAKTVMENDFDRAKLGQKTLSESEPSAYKSARKPDI